MPSIILPMYGITPSQPLAAAAMICARIPAGERIWSLVKWPHATMKGPVPAVRGIV